MELKIQKPVYNRPNLPPIDQRTGANVILPTQHLRQDLHSLDTIKCRGTKDNE
jgi:hypothetical protein